MGSAAVQGSMWGAKARDWSELAEPVGRPAIDVVLARAGVKQGTRLLDVGCGAGLALVVARGLGAEVCGLDAAESLVAIARERVPGARIEVGEMESLPFADASFDVVTGFNSFQFAADTVAALREARRVCRPGGTVAMLVWGPPEQCDSIRASFSAVMALLPPPPTNNVQSLSQPGVIEARMVEAGLAPTESGDVDIPFDYPSVDAYLRAVTSAGILVNAARQLGDDTVRRTLTATLPPFTRPDGSVHQLNRWHWVMAKRT